jgi:choice-of-anchor A domain-containing protein
VKPRSASSFLRSIPRIAGAALLVATASVLRSASLVDGFNVTVFNNFSSQYSDLQGTLAVGKNLTLTGYALNQSAPHPNTTGGGFDTVVGGSLFFQYGAMYGPVSAGAATVSGASICAGCVSTGGASPLNFAQLETSLRNENSFLYSLSSTGTVSQPYSTLTLNGSGTAGLEVFSISSSQLSSNSGIAIAGVSSTATILINVLDSGSHLATTSSSGFSINGQQVQNAPNVVFNFASTITNISITNSFYSSLLAPNAGVSGSYGAFNGDLVAANYSGNNQFNLDPFTGAIPIPPTSAPEPGTLGTLILTALSGAACLFLGKFRRAKTSNASVDD